MKTKMKAVVEWLIAIILVLAACACYWLIGDVSGIRYQRDMVKLPSGSGMANYFELNGESEVPLNLISENQSVAVFLLINKGAWLVG